MNRYIKVVIAAGLLAAAGCDSETTEVIDRSIQTVQLTASSTQVEKGQVVQLTAVAKRADGTVLIDVAMEWTVSDTTIATLTVNGHSAVLKGKRAGVAGIMAKAASKAALVQIEVTETAPANPVPLIDWLEPSAATSGTTGTLVKVKGANFTPQSVVRWNDIPKATTYVSASELQFIATPFDILAPGDADVRVFTPAPGGGMSPGSLNFTIYGPAHSISLAAPAEQSIWVGQQFQLVPVVKDELGRVLSGVEVNWATTNNTVVQVDAAGRVSAIRAGSSLVSARVGQAVTQAGFQVLAPPAADLIFDAIEDGIRQLFVVSPGPNPNRRKILPDGIQATQAAVTRDGQRIAFTGVGADGSTEIFTMNRDGSGLKQLTFSTYADEQPVWSPDGQRIAFRSRRNLGYSDIWIMNADGSDQVNLTDTGVRVGLYGYEHATWSPDGQYMVYTLANEGMSPLRSTLMKMHIANRTPEILVQDNTIDVFEPAYSPDGTMVVVRHKSAALGDQVLTLNPANGEFWILLDYPGPGSNPAFAPDNKWIAFESSPVGNGSRGVYVNVLGTHHRIGVGVGSAAGIPANPVWISR